MYLCNALIHLYRGIMQGMNCDHLVDTVMGYDKKMTIDILKNALTDLKADSNVESSAIISNDGILVTSDMDSNLNVETIASITSVVRNSAILTLQAIGKKSIKRLIIETDDGAKMVTVCAGSKTMVTALVTSDENIEPCFEEIAKTAEIVKSYFE